MPPSDWQEVNFGQKYEVDYIVNLYPKKYRDKVRDALEEIKNNKSNEHLTHKEVYEILAKEYGLKKS